MKKVLLATHKDYLSDRQFSIIEKLGNSKDTKYKNDFQYQLLKTLIKYNTGKSTKTCTRKQYKHLLEIFRNNRVRFADTKRRNTKRKSTQVQENPIKGSRQYNKREITTDERDILTQLLKPININVLDDLQVQLIRSILNIGIYTDEQFKIIDAIYKRFGFRPNLNEFKTPKYSKK